MRRTEPFGRASDFSAVADRYDATREMPGRTVLACYDRLIELGMFPAAGTVLDAGCGTGQISLPLAARGYEVRGIDISPEMTQIAQSKVQPGWRARYAVGDVRDIAEADGSVDAVVVSKLFQHIEDWQAGCRELIRIVRPGGYIVQINERGAFGNAVRRQFAKRAGELGFNRRYVGLDPHSDEQLGAFMASQGCRVVQIDNSDLSWELTISFGEALSRIQQRLFAEFWCLPADVYDRLLADTIAWVDTQENGRNAVEHLKPYLVVHAFRTPDGR